MHKPALFWMNGFMVLFLTCLSVGARAQQPGFLILIEAENKQAFTVRIGDQFFASTGQGHLVISQLKDSNYNLCIRFPKNELPEQVFPVALHKKDLGFQLRGADSSWILYNWQNKETIRPINIHDSSRILSKGTKRVDGFSRLMAAVVNDSSVMYNTYTGPGFNGDSSTFKSQLSVTKSQSSIINPIVPVSSGSTQNGQTFSATPTPAPAKNNKKDSLILVKKSVPVSDSLLIAKKTTPFTDSARTVSVSHSLSAGTSSVKKLREITLKVSRKMVFQDIEKDGHVDTITLFVYFENGDSLAKKQNTTSAVAGTRNVKSADSTNKSLSLNKTNQKSAETTCSQAATDDDVSFVRSAILKANTEQDKIGVASDAFAIKCFSVSQIRLLASLLVSDKAKFRLMDAAHLHITDPDHFRELVDMLTDKNFQRKFLVMADKRS
jgi:Domain of unknown function (DUF4476)